MSWLEVSGSLLKHKTSRPKRSRKKLYRNRSAHLNSLLQKPNFQEDLASFATTGELPDKVRLNFGYEIYNLDIYNREYTYWMCSDTYTPAKGLNIRIIKWNMKLSFDNRYCIFTLDQKLTTNPIHLFSKIWCF